MKMQLASKMLKNNQLFASKPFNIGAFSNLHFTKN